jgi:hypothetical protein
MGLTALAALEESNTSLDGVLTHIDFNGKVGQSKMSDQKLRNLIDHLSKYPLRNEDFDDMVQSANGLHFGGVDDWSDDDRRAPGGGAHRGPDRVDVYVVGAGATRPRTWAPTRSPASSRSGACGSTATTPPSSSMVRTSLATRSTDNDLVPKLWPDGFCPGTGVC